MMPLLNQRLATLYTISLNQYAFEIKTTLDIMTVLERSLTESESFCNLGQKPQLNGLFLVERTYFA